MESRDVKNALSAIRNNTDNAKRGMREIESRFQSLGSGFTQHGTPYGQYWDKLKNNLRDADRSLEKVNDVLKDIEREANRR